MDRSIIIFVAVALAVLISASCCGGARGDDDLEKEIGKAKTRLQSDFILNLWYETNQAISTSQEKVLKLYTEYTAQQAHIVVEHISRYVNTTKSECAEKREKILETKNLPKLLSTLECVFVNEVNTMRAFKLTGYNLHNCIRMAQNDLERKYLKIVDNLNNIKNVSLKVCDSYLRTMDNCVESRCVMVNLFRSIIEYEKLRDQLSTNVTEVNNISARYVMSGIAMDCVYNSLKQIEENYEIGKGLVDKCLTETTSGSDGWYNSTGNANPGSESPKNL